MLPLFSDHGSKSPPGLNPANPLSALEMTRLALFKMYNQVGLPPGGPPGPPGPLGAGLNQASLEMGRAMVEQQARALQAAQREAEAREREREREKASRSPKSPEIRLQQHSTPNNKNNSSKEDARSSDAISGRSKDSDKSRDIEEDDDMSPPPMKRERVDSFDHRNGSPVLPGANIRIANRGTITQTIICKWVLH